MKNILMAFIFLASQVSFSKQNNEIINSKGFHLENQKLSSLVLSKEELIHLTAQQKSDYFISMIALAQIIEIKQADVLAYEDEAQSTKKSTSTLFYESLPENLKQKLQFYFSQENKAHAIAPAILFAGGAALQILWEVGKFAVKRMAARKLAKQEAVALATKLAGEGGKKRLTGVVKENAIKAAAKNSAAAVKKAEAKEILKGMLKKSAVSGSLLVTEETIMKDLTGTSLLDISPEELQSLVGELKSELGLSGYFADLKSGDSKKEKGKSCLFGGHPSVWKDFGSEAGGIKCTRPEASVSSSCKGEKFLCNSYGLKVNDQSIDSEMCISKTPLDDLTVRCSKKLMEVVDKKKASLPEDQINQFGDSLKKQLIQLETSDAMKDEDEKVKSIAAYCAAENVDQKPECASIKEILVQYKASKVAELIASRSPDKEAGKSAEAASGAASEGKATEAGQSQ